jgi:hypothetical protein
MPVISTIAAATARAFGAFKSAAGGAADEFFKYVTLLLHGDGTNGAQNNTFLDSSTNNFTITRNGNTTQGTFSPFSQTGWSNYFDGTGDWLSVADNTALQMGSGNFTIEFWWYPTSLTGYQSPIDKGYTGSGALLLQTGNGDGKIIVYATSAVITASTAVTANAWNHVALVRNGTSLVLYLNGVSVGSATNSTNFNNASAFGIGSSVTTSNYPIYGYMSNVRIVKGTAVYTSAFTPSTTPLTAITNTSLLTCQSNRFRDASTNNFAITVNGNTSVQAFSPFAPTAAYSAATVGGSGYFDGSGDYLTTISSAQFAWGTGDFSIECWIYRTVSGFMRVLPFSDDLGNLAIDSSNRIELWTGSAFNSGSYTVPVNSWTHLCATRQSGTCRLFLNGVLAATTSNSFNKGNGAAEVGAASIYGDGVTGYIANVRHVKGGVPSAYSTSSTTVGAQIFTPATSPITSSDSLTAGSLSLLLNFTNGGIIDNTAKNVLETVGNAQISTSVKKFGTGSLAFDGSGDYLTSYSSTNFEVGSGDFTLEAWLYPTSYNGFFGKNTTDDHKYFKVDVQSDGTITFYVTNTGSSWQINSSSSAGVWELNTWWHFAIVRSGTSFKVYKNGTQIISATMSGSVYTTTNAPFILGATSLPGFAYIQVYSGYIDDLRITKGVARYTTTFTPPTAAFADQ